MFAVVQIKALELCKTTNILINEIFRNTCLSKRKRAVDCILALSIEPEVRV